MYKLIELRSHISRNKKILRQTQNRIVTKFNYLIDKIKINSKNMKKITIDIFILETQFNNID